jgi:hypothetical protein
MVREHRWRYSLSFIQDATTHEKMPEFAAGRGDGLKYPARTLRKAPNKAT